MVDLKSSLSESTKSTSTTSSPSSTKPLQQNVNQVQRGNATHVAPQITPDSPKSPVRQESSSPSRGLRQSPTLRQRIQLENTNSKNRFSVLADEESMECGAPPSAPSSPTPGKSPGAFIMIQFLSWRCGDPCC